LTIRRSWRNPGWIGYLGGVSPIDQQVQVFVNNRAGSSIYCPANQPTTIEIALPIDRVDLIEIRFSSSVIDAKGRNVSFLLEATNLFAEADLYT
jgi:hypothetical protein